MSEWISTGDMINAIKVGDVYEPDDRAYNKITRTILGIRIVDRHSNKPWDSIKPMTNPFLTQKWRKVDEVIPYD